MFLIRESLTDLTTQVYSRMGRNSRRKLKKSYVKKFCNERKPSNSLNRKRIIMRGINFISYIWPPCQKLSSLKGKNFPLNVYSFLSTRRSSYSANIALFTSPESYFTSFYFVSSCIVDTFIGVSLQLDSNRQRLEILSALDTVLAYHQYLNYLSIKIHYYNVISWSFWCLQF